VGLILYDVIELFNKLNPSSRTIALRLTQKCVGIFLGVKGDRPEHKADNLTAICNPVFLNKCESFHTSQPHGPIEPVNKDSFVFNIFNYIL
jgi:hypothetical protein